MRWSHQHAEYLQIDPYYASALFGCSQLQIAPFRSHHLSKRVGYQHNLHLPFTRENIPRRQKLCKTGRSRYPSTLKFASNSPKVSGPYSTWEISIRWKSEARESPSTVLNGVCSCETPRVKIVGQPMVNWWFGARWFGIPGDTPFCNNPCHKGIPKIPNHRAPDQQLTIGWVGMNLEKQKRPTWTVWLCFAFLLEPSI